MFEEKKVVLACVAFAVMCAVLCGCASAAQSVSGEIDKLGEITLGSGPALEAVNQKYESLDDAEKQKVENYTVLEDANKKYTQLLYSTINQQLKQADTLAANYFAQYYDLAHFEEVKDAAAAAIESSEEDSYKDVHAALGAEIEQLQTFINEEMGKSYSSHTRYGEYPFMVEESDLPDKWSFKPIRMLTSSHPNWVTSEKIATDLPTYINLFIKGGSRRYSYRLEQTPVKEITVQDANGEIQTAYVNTQVNFVGEFDQSANNDPNKELNERPAYFFTDKKGRLNLALQNYDGEDYFVLYTIS